MRFYIVLCFQLTLSITLDSEVRNRILLVLDLSPTVRDLNHESKLLFALLCLLESGQVLFWFNIEALAQWLSTCLTSVFFKYR